MTETTIPADATKAAHEVATYCQSRLEAPTLSKCIEVERHVARIIADVALAPTIRQRDGLLAAAIELEDLIRSVIEGDLPDFDSFTLQPIQLAIAACETEGVAS